MSLFWLVFLFDEHDFSTCTRDVFFFWKYIPNEFVFFRKQFQKDGVHGVLLLFGKGNALPETNISPF